MMAVGLSETEICSYLLPFQQSEDCLSVACINSPRNVTISGSEKHIDALSQVLENGNIFHRKLKVNIAYHSHSMSEVAFIYGTLIGSREANSTHSANPQMFSSVTGTAVSIE